MSFSLLLLCLATLFVKGGAQTPMAITHNEKYLFTGSVSLTSAHASGTIKKDYKVQAFYVPFPQSLANASFVEVFLGLQSISFSMQRNVSEVVMMQNVKETYFILETLEIIFITLQKITARYVILTNQYSSFNSANMKVGVG